MLACWRRAWRHVKCSIVSWEPEGHYHYSTMFRWEPEGRYHYSTMFRWEPEGRYPCTKSMVIAPFWFSTEHLWIVIMAFWFSADDMVISLDFKALQTIWHSWVSWHVLSIFVVITGIHEIFPQIRRFDSRMH